MMKNNQNKDLAPIIHKSPNRFLQKVKSMKKWSLKYILFAIPFVQTLSPTFASPAHAVMNIPPSNLSKLKDEAAGISKQQKKPKPDLIEPDPSHPQYQGKQDSYEMDLRIYHAKLKAREDELQKMADEKKRILPTQPQSEQQMAEQLAALQMLQQLPSSSSSSSTPTESDSTTASTSTSTSFTPPKVKVAAVPKTKGQKKIKTSKQRAKQVAVQTLRYGGFITAGVIFAKAQAEKEKIRVQKGIEIFESQKAEYFNITGKADSDEDLADELKNLKGNSTDVDDEDDDDEDYEDDLPIRKKPSGNNGGGGPSGSGMGGGSPPSSPPKKDAPVRDEKASDDDVERMKRLFDK